MNNNDVTLIIPAKQESISLPIVLKKLENYNFEIFVILDRTDIETIESIKYLKHKLIFQENLNLPLPFVNIQLFVETFE